MKSKTLVWTLAGLVLVGGGVAAALLLRGAKDHTEHAESAEANEQDDHEHAEMAAEEFGYTCPMHPQIVEKQPGECPICGMDLVKKVPEVDKAKGEAKLKAEADAHRKIKHWVAPMDPTYISDKPGKSPMGMDLVPVYEDDGKSGSTLTIDPVVVQNMGVRIARVKRGPLFLHIRTIGTVDVAENQLSVVNLRYSGWIERIFVDETGVQVKKGQPLFTIYSPELVSAQEEFLLALRGAGQDSALAASARTRLSFWNLPAGQIDRLAKAGKATRTVTVVAPQTGYVLHKSVVQGARVNAGVDLYRIGNLDKIWVNAEVYEFDAPWVQVGNPATMTLSFQGSQAHRGEVSYVYPTLNAKTRTLTVRLEFDNPGLQLRPGSFATVQIEAQRQENVLVVPTEAVIHSGDRDIVFVALDLGHYEKREIATGLVGDRYLTEVRAGLHEGERVVTSGQFLLDSESQMQEAVQKLLAARLHAKEKRKRAAGDSGQKESKSDGKSEGADSYWTCGMHPTVVEDGPGSCPICGMDLTEQKR